MPNGITPIIPEIYYKVKTIYSRDYKRWVLYIGRSRGRGRYTIYTDRQHIGTACGSKGRQGKIGILASRAKGV